MRPNWQKDYAKHEMMIMVIMMCASSKIIYKRQRLQWRPIEAKLKMNRFQVILNIIKTSFKKIAFLSVISQPHNSLVKWFRNLWPTLYMYVCIYIRLQQYYSASFHNHYHETFRCNNFHIVCVKSDLCKCATYSPNIFQGCRNQGCLGYYSTPNIS